MAKRRATEQTSTATGKVDNDYYEAELERLQLELVRQQEWIRVKGLRVVVIFEGRDAAGKGGAIKRITEPLNPRAASVVALAAPTARERSQWYFQRYVDHLPAAGEMVVFDRSWYNRAGVERVMGFCTDVEYQRFMADCAPFEAMLVGSGIIVVKYWFSVSDAEQEKRFQARLADPAKRWKLSPMDLQARERWADFSRAKDAMLAATDSAHAPWWVVEADVKKRARLNVMSHLLAQVPYEDLTPPAPELPPRPPVDDSYERPPFAQQNLVPDVVPAAATKKTKGKSKGKGKGKKNEGTSKDENAKGKSDRSTDGSKDDEGKTGGKSEAGSKGKTGGKGKTASAVPTTGTGARTGSAEKASAGKAGKAGTKTSSEAGTTRSGTTKSGAGSAEKSAKSGTKGRGTASGRSPAGPGAGPGRSGAGAGSGTSTATGRTKGRSASASTSKTRSRSRS